MNAQDVVPPAAPAAVAATPPASGAPRREGRFQNHYIDFQPKGVGDLLKWRIEAARGDVPKPPRTETPRVAPDLAFVRSNAVAGAAMTPALTWIGHASSLVQMGGVNLLIDPVFSERASPVGFAGPKRHVPAGLTLAELPHIDAVLISHNHYDHLDDASVRSLAAQPGGPPLFVVPLGIRTWLAERKITNAVELDWWQSVRLGKDESVEIVFTPSQHWSSRSLGDRMKTLWGGYAVFAPDFQLFFAGDTAYSKDFADIHARFASRHGGPTRGFDLALIPIGAYEPRWFMKEQHVDPAEAVQIHLDLFAQHSIGVHWGVFELTDEPRDEPPQALARAPRRARRRRRCVRRHGGRRDAALRAPQREPLIALQRRGVVDRQARHVDAKREHATRMRIARQLVGRAANARGRDVARLQIGTAEARHRRAHRRQLHFAQQLARGREPQHAAARIHRHPVAAFGVDRSAVGPAARWTRVALEPLVEAGEFAPAAHGAGGEVVVECPDDVRRGLSLQYIVLPSGLQARPLLMVMSPCLRSSRPRSKQ